MTYKVEICKSPGWRNHKACVLGVSTPSPNWRGEKFAAILGFAAANSNELHIDVTDALYAHNFMADGAAPDEAHRMAMNLGDQWLTENMLMIDACPLRPKIVRWSAWYNHPGYDAALMGFRLRYADNSLLREMIEADVDQFFVRRDIQPTMRQRAHARDFILEEMAVLSLQGSQMPAVRLYPGNQLNSMRVLRQGLIPGVPEGLEKQQFACVRCIPSA